MQASTFIRIFPALLLLLSCLIAHAVERPNLLLVLTDDQHATAAGYASDGAYHTPQLDRLAERSLRFDRAYAALSLCSPSRASVLSGTYGSVNGVTNIGQAMRHPEHSLGHWLKAAGYQTAVSGKWHLKNSPRDLGFDWAVTFWANGPWYGRKVDRQGETVRPPELVDLYCTKESVRFLRERDPDKPFFLFHNTQLPHMDNKQSWPASEESLARFVADDMPLPSTWAGLHEQTGKPAWLSSCRNRSQALKYGYDKPSVIREHRREYRATMADLDAALAPLWAELDAQKLWDNTVVVFLGDNGWMLGEHGLTSKVLAYEASARVPMLIAAPDLSAGRCDALVSNLDIAPTLLAFAGVDAPAELQGEALQPLLAAPNASVRDTFRYEGLGGYGGVPPMSASISTTEKTITTWKSPAFEEAVFTERYDLVRDPNERVNRIPVQARTPAKPAEGPRRTIDGIHPHLAFHNLRNECGTGAVVPWADRLWAITYAPHEPAGSDDKLYEITPDLELRVFPGSVGGTPANRMIHKETDQLLIGPYLIDRERQIRVLPPNKMYGRLTGTARHLHDPGTKVYYATMEEGFYEVDLASLAVTAHIKDGHGNAPKEGIASALPGYHGKGLYSGQGRVVFSNNGEKGRAAMTDPTTPSGALAEWRKPGEDWQLVRRNQFTEITGPGGIHGNPNPATDPVWAMGWDPKSVLLMLLENGAWQTFRLPKGSHSYDGAHGWNTEWPRIREIGEGDRFLATMHGTFWTFPATFSNAKRAGIRPRSNYLKVIGDFCRWGDHVVLGCDDSAKAEFLNKRPFKAEHASPLQSNSMREDLAAGATSDPFLFRGYDKHQIVLHHETASEVTFELELDRLGDGTWERVKSDKIAAGTTRFMTLGENAEWIRFRANQDATGVTVHLHLWNEDRRGTKAPALFDGIARTGIPAATRGLLRSLAHDRLGLVALDENGKEIGFYELGPDLVPRPSADAEARNAVLAAAQPNGTYKQLAGSIQLSEDGFIGRLPDGVGAPLPKAPAKTGATLVDLLPQSLAKTAAVTVSSTLKEYRGALVLDGNTEDESRWVSAKDQAGPKWLALDLGEEKTIASVGVLTGWQHDPAHAARHLEVQVKQDDEWTAVAAVDDNAGVSAALNFDKPTSARHLRLLSNDPGYLRVYEVGVFAKTIEIEPLHSATDLSIARVCREVATERDLLNVGGTLYELPARNAGGLAKIRPVASHDLAIHDFCSHAGLLFFTGIDADTESDRIFRSDDGKAAVWAGTVDELWQLERVRGGGFLAKETLLKAGVPSTPLLVTATPDLTYDIESSAATDITFEVDVDGTGLWLPFETVNIESSSAKGELSVGAYWIRMKSSNEATVTCRIGRRS